MFRLLHFVSILLIAQQNSHVISGLWPILLRSQGAMWNEAGKDLSVSNNSHAQRSGKLRRRIDHKNSCASFSRLAPVKAQPQRIVALSRKNRTRNCLGNRIGKLIGRKWRGRITLQYRRLSVGTCNRKLQRAGNGIVGLVRSEEPRV